MSVWEKLDDSPAGEPAPPKKKRGRWRWGEGLKLVGLMAVVAAAIAVAKGGCHGSRVAIRNGEVYYTKGVTEAEARAFARYAEREMRPAEFVTFQLARSGGVYQVRMPVKAGVDSDPLMIAAFRRMAAEVSRDVFDGSPVEAHMCDDRLNTLRVVVPLR